MDLNTALVQCGIRDLAARYNYLGDAGRSADVAGLFTEDGVLEYQEDSEIRRCEGRTEITAFLDEVKARWLQEAARSALPPRVFHSVGTHVIDVRSPDAATGKAYVWVVRSGGLAEWGTYEDRYVARDGLWRFAARRAAVSGRDIGGSLIDRPTGH